jgi:hypothetical protein
MGRIVKPFTVTYGNTSVSDSAQIDTGADMSILKRELAKQLEISESDVTLSLGEGVGKGGIFGIEIPVKIRVEDSEAAVTAFVPLAEISEDNKAKDMDAKNNLIGVDFLQATGAKLDYSKPHKSVFSGPVGIRFFHKIEMTPAIRMVATQYVKKFLGKKGPNGEQILDLSRKVRSMMKK